MVISGCDTGFGRLVALQLGAEGYTVFCGVFTSSGAESLLKEFEEKKGSSNGKLIPIPLDITKADSVKNFVSQVSTHINGSPIHVLVNNAGIGLAAPLEILPYDDFYKVIDVNLLGHVRMLQNFLPFLRKAPAPRIINITSLAGLIAGPEFAAYSASKFGLEAVTDSIRRELINLNFSVSAIEPGFAKTQILVTNVEYIAKLKANASPELRAAYQIPEGLDMKRYEATTQAAMDPGIVVKSIHHAITSPTPLTRYRVGIHAHVFSFLIWLLPDHVIDVLIEYFRKRTRQKVEEKLAKKDQ